MEWFLRLHLAARVLVARAPRATAAAAILGGTAAAIWVMILAPGFVDLGIAVVAATAWSAWIDRNSTTPPQL